METYEDKLKRHAEEFLKEKVNPKGKLPEVNYLDDAIVLIKSELSKFIPKEKVEKITLYGKDLLLSDLHIYHLLYQPDQYHEVRKRKGAIGYGVLLYKFDRAELNDSLRKIFGETHG